MIEIQQRALLSSCKLGEEVSFNFGNQTHRIMISLPWQSFYTQTSSAEITPTVMSTYAMAMTILFIVFVFSLEHMLDSRQQRAYKITEFPTLLEETVAKIDQEKAMQKKTSDSSTDSSDNDAKEKDEKDLDKDKPILPQLKEKFAKAQTYGTDKLKFGMFSSVYNLVETIAFLLVGFIPYTWDLSVTLGATYFEYNEKDHEIKITLIFLLLSTIISTITALPFELVRILSPYS